jgi:hypothetical protein
MSGIIKGLSLWRPWPWAILHAGKRVENRSWKPPVNMIGQYLALHAAQKWDADGYGSITEITRNGVPALHEHPAGVIVGVARLSHAIHEDDFDTFNDPASLPEDQRAWFFGPWGWMLDNVIAIEPVHCKGAQGLWPLPPDVLALVRGRYANAHAIPPPVLADEINRGS